MDQHGTDELTSGKTRSVLAVEVAQLLCAVQVLRGVAATLQHERDAARTIIAALQQDRSSTEAQMNILQQDLDAAKSRISSLLGGTQRPQTPEVGNLPGIRD